MIKDIVIIDIDGCLNHYPNPLKMWAEVTLNLDKSESKQAIKKKNDLDLLKKTYRQSDVLEYLLPRKGAKESLEKIKKKDYTIILLTSRNPDKNPQIKAITVSWLNKYKIPYDSIIFTKNKSAYIKKQEDRIMMVVEDEPKIFNSFKKLKTEVIVFKNDLNKGVNKLYFHSVSSWKEIDSLFDGFISK